MFKHPWMVALGAGLLVLLVAMALPLWHMLQGPVRQAGLPASPEATAADQGLPWQVQPLADGRSRVFGLVLGQDTLAQAQARFGDVLQLALVARVDETGALEALVEPMSAGHVSGRLVLAFDVPPATLSQWRARATGSEVMAGGVRRFSLAAADRAAAAAMPLAGLSFVPSLRLTEDDMQHRFGTPSQRLVLGDGVLQLVYADRGLVASLAPGRRSVLQYVAPRELGSRLLAPVQR